MDGKLRRNSNRDQLVTKRSAAAAGRRHRPDYWLLVLTALMLTVGLVVVYSISPGLAASQHISQNYFISKQLIDVVFGAAAFAAASAVPIRTWQRMAYPLAIAAAVGSVIVLLTPIDAVYQAHRWIRFAGLSFQIAELIKLALLVWLASFLSAQWRAGKVKDFKATLRPLIMILLAVGIVVAKLQSDLGSAGVMVAMMGLMGFSVGIPLKRVALFGGLVVIFAALAIASSSYRRERLQTFLHPQNNCQTTSYQACQALISVGSGGLFGLGLGYSVQAYGYTPEASNDSIFAIMGEQFGFIGSVVIIAMYGAFIARLKHIIERTGDQFSRLLVVGTLAWLSTQMIINIGAMIGLLPLKGITLPLISQGGTSLIFLMAALGVVFQVSRYTSYGIAEPDNNIDETVQSNNSSDRGRIRRPYHASVVSRPRT